MVTLVLGSDWKSASTFVRARIGAYERAHEGAVALRVDVSEGEEDVFAAFSAQQLFGTEQCVVFTHADAREDFLLYCDARAKQLSEVGDGYVLWCESSRKDIAQYTNLLRYSEVHEFMRAETGEVPQQEIFAFSDLVIAGRGREALLKLEQLRRRGVSEERLFYGVKSHAENIATVGVLAKQGAPASEIVSRTKLHPYVVEKCLGQLRARPSVQRLNEVLLRFDMESKKGLAEYPEGFYEVLLN